MILKRGNKRAFILLAVVGVLAVLGILVFGLALNVDLTYRYTKHRASQRELSQLLRSSAEMLARNASLLEQVSKSQGEVPVSEIRGTAKVAAQRAAATQAQPEILRAAQLVVLRAIPERPGSVSGRVALYAIRPGATPVLIAEASKMLEGGK